jgi:excisionase family DNA binding protein
MTTTTFQIHPDMEFLNLNELARVLRVSAVSVYRLAQRRAIPVYRVSRKLLFRRRDVLEYLERRKTDVRNGL